MKRIDFSKFSIKTELNAFIMAIVNLTEDSFYQQGKKNIDDILTLMKNGADIIDIGGESTRPGSLYISAEEELERIIPVIEKIREYSDIPISVDTRKKIVMEEAYKVGANILNDVSALEDDKDMVDFIAVNEIPVVLMHKKGIPLTMQESPSYKNVFSEVNEYLSSRVDFALRHGVLKSNIIVDPGIGFGKRLEDNRELIRKCGDLCNGEYPVLMALSRKSCIGEITRQNVDNRLFGTLSANLISVQKGASILRVHDVAPCRDSLAVLQYLEA